MAVEVKSKRWQANFMIHKDVLERFQAKAREMCLVQGRLVEKLIVRWLEENNGKEK